MNDKILKKKTHENRNRHIAMYPSTKFEEIEIVRPNLSKKNEEQKF